jgi:hypothetical protein
MNGDLNTKVMTMMVINTTPITFNEKSVLIKPSFIVNTIYSYLTLNKGDNP